MGKASTLTPTRHVWCRLGSYRDLERRGSSIQFDSIQFNSIRFIIAQTARGSISLLCRYCHRCLDPYGDHLFQCKYNKKILSDNIRDTIYTICLTLAPLAGFTHSPHSISCETSDLLPTFPTKCPADVGIHLRPLALSSTPNTPIDFLAVDITVTKTPAVTTDEPASQTNPVSEAHLHSLRRKLSHSADVHNPSTVVARTSTLVAS
jgi:hypothetical protein